MPSDIPGIERLLYVATSRGSLEWTDWKAACASVAAADDLGGMSPAECARSLEQLGHAEIAPRQGAVSVCAAPAVLARLPRAGLPQAVLCGGRSPQTAARIGAAAAEAGARLSVHDRGPLAPRIFHFSADSVADLAQTAAGSGVRFSENPPAWVLAAAAGSIARYLAGLEWKHEPESAIPAREQDPARGLPGPHAPGRVGLRLINYFPRRARPYFELRDGGRAARVERDWALWLCVQAAGSNALVYDEKACAVAVPAHLKLPRPLGRMLGLCSGFPPAVLACGGKDWPAKGQPFHVFTGIPANIAAALFDRLGQDPLPLEIPPLPA